MYEISLQKDPTASLQVEPMSAWQTVMQLCFQRTFTGVGLRSVVLSNLYPDEDHSVKVRCGAQRYFWKWGDWSEPFSFRTNKTSKCRVVVN